jgi:hypothetical protein
MTADMAVKVVVVTDPSVGRILDSFGIARRACGAACRELPRGGDR